MIQKNSMVGLDPGSVRGVRSLAPIKAWTGSRPLQWRDVSEGRFFFSPCLLAAVWALN